MFQNKRGDSFVFVCIMGITFLKTGINWLEYITNQSILKKKKHQEEQKLSLKYITWVVKGIYSEILLPLMEKNIDNNKKELYN